MRHEPRGGAIRKMRLSTTETLEDGSTVKLTLSAPGFIVRLAHQEGRKPSAVRRDFTRFCSANGIIMKPVEHSGGTFSRRTGNPIAGSEPQPTAYQVMGEPAALMLLLEHHTIGEYHAALAVRVPVIAGGNGEERPRPSSGTVFGKPNTVSATATQLAKQHSERIRSDRKAWAAETAK